MIFFLWYFFFFFFFFFALTDVLAHVLLNFLRSYYIMSAHQSAGERKKDENLDAAAAELHSAKTNSVPSSSSNVRLFFLFLRRLDWTVRGGRLEDHFWGDASEKQPRL